MGKKSKSRPGGTDQELDKAPVYLTQEILRKRLSQCGTPPEICGYQQERRYSNSH